jgi:hypothetical protein
METPNKHSDDWHRPRQPDCGHSDVCERLAILETNQKQNLTEVANMKAELLKLDKTIDHAKWTISIVGIACTTVLSIVHWLPEIIKFFHG